MTFITNNMVGLSPGLLVGLLEAGLRPIVTTGKTVERVLIARVMPQRARIRRDRTMDCFCAGQALDSALGAALLSLSVVEKSPTVSKSRKPDWTKCPGTLYPFTYAKRRRAAVENKVRG
jgi:hypothetical protein